MRYRLQHHDQPPRLSEVCGRPGFFALVPEPLPRTLSLSEALLPLEQAAGSVAGLQAHLDSAVFGDNMVRTASRIDATALSPTAPAAHDLLRLLILDASEERPGPRDLRGASNAIDAYDHGLAIVRAQGRSGLTLGLLKDLHRLFSAGIAVSGVAGEFRGGRTLGRVRASRIVSPAGPEIAPFLDDLERFLTDPPPLPLPLRQALVAAQIESLMPFEHGSSQIAWLLLPLMAAAEGRPPVFLAQTFMAIRAEYDAALFDLQINGHWEGWFGFFLQQVALAAGALIGCIEHVARLQRVQAVELESLRSDSTARRLAERVLGMPVLSVGKAQELLGVSFQTANAAVATLVRFGILSQHANMRRNRVFLVGQTLAMLDLTPIPEEHSEIPSLETFFRAL